MGVGRALESADLPALFAVGTALPDTDAVVQIDETDPRDQVITDGRCTVGPNDIAVLEAQVPVTGSVVTQHPWEVGVGVAAKA